MPPIQWNWILWLESPSQADSHGFYRPKPTEADRSTKNIGFPMHFVCLSHPIAREVSVTKSIKKHCKIA